MDVVSVDALMRGTAYGVCSAVQRRRDSRQSDRSPASISPPNRRPGQGPRGPAHTLPEQIVVDAGYGDNTFGWDVTVMSSDESLKSRARARQKETGESYMRARRMVDNRVPDAAGREAADLTAMRSLLGLRGVTAADITALWANHELPAGTGEHVHRGGLLRIPVGIADSGEPVWVDLKSGGVGGVGPHGCVMGATGSGKSTVLQSIAFALCVQHSPDLLQLLLIDAKGSSGGPFSAPFRFYPHVAFLDGAANYKAALRDLFQGRSAALAGADAADITDYHRIRASAEGGALPPLPYTVVMIDELSQLGGRDPDDDVLALLLTSGGRLGIHVLFSNQPVSTDATIARSAERVNFRLLLRMSAAESRRLLGGRAIPSPLELSGEGYLFHSASRAAFPSDAVRLRGFRIPADVIDRAGRSLAGAWFR